MAIDIVKNRGVWGRRLLTGALSLLAMGHVWQLIVRMKA